MKKGFTLIELLAVIVILAIIALIATPIVLNIINDTKKSATIRSADFYVNAVQNEIALENMKVGGSFNPSECEITNGIAKCDGKELTIKVDGEMPTSGTITFEEGKITGVELMYPSGIVTQNNKGELVISESKNEPICTLISGETNTIGSKYQCKVKDDMETGFEDGYYFFVLSHNDDGTTNLIMERNIYYDETNDVGKVATEANKGLVAWYAPSQTNSFGPVTAMDYLYKTTKDWDNIPNIVVNYTDEGNNYGTIRTTNNITKITKKDGSAVTVLTDKEGYTNLKSRLPKYSEVTGEGKCTSSFSNCPYWLVNYLDSDSYETGGELQNIRGIYGYLTFSSEPGVSDYAHYVYFHSMVRIHNVNASNFDGIRPVITLNL